MDLNELAMFVEVVDAGSFASAASRLGMPANSLSRRISQLEADLGVRLLHRSTRKLTLTHAGISLHEGSAARIFEMRQAAKQISASADLPQGILRIAAPADFFDFFSVEWVAEFLKKYPKIELAFLLSDSRADLIGDSIDVAFRAGELPDSSLVARKIGTDRLALAASPKYLKESGRPATIQALAKHECIRGTKKGRTIWHLEGPRGAQQVEISGRFSANTAQSQLRGALAGLGICLLPVTLLRRHIEDGRLICVLPRYGQSGGGFFALYSSRKQVSPAVTSFIDIAIKKLGAQEG